MTANFANQFLKLSLNLSVLISILVLTACSGSNGKDTTPPLESPPSISATSLNVVENAGIVAITVRLSAATSAAVNVSWETSDGTAAAGSDYIAASGQLTISPGFTQGDINIDLIDDLIEESEENFELVLSSTDGTVTTNPVIISITDNDSEMDIIGQEALFNPDWDAIGVFTNARTCGSCHRASVTSDVSSVMRLPRETTGEDISPFSGWNHSAMAHAWNDPYFQAVMEHEVTEFPDMAGDIEDKCLKCHTPMGHTHAKQTLLNLSVDACSAPEGCYRSATAEIEDHAKEGVSCTACHQIRDSATLEIDGEFSIASSTDADARTIYGPYFNNLSAGAMRNNVFYEITGSEHISDSKLCASCHDLHTSTIDINTASATGEEFREQSPYGEWANSTFNDGDANDQSCQACHMPQPDNYQTPIAVTQNGSSNPNWPERSPYSEHVFSGGNSYLLSLLKIYRKELGIEATTTEEGFDLEIEKTNALLKTAADLKILEVSKSAANELLFDVEISNNTGHKLPTSYPSRRVWLNVKLFDADDNLVFESGTPGTNGQIADDAMHASVDCVKATTTPDVSNDECYQVHHNLITSQAQVPVYQALMADTNGRITYTLLHADEYLKDNRIPPVGFSASDPRFDPETAVAGLAVEDADFNKDNGVEGSGKDTIHYVIPDLGSLAGIRIETNLWYQSITPASIGALIHDGKDAARFKLMASQNPEQPKLIASLTEWHEL